MSKLTAGQIAIIEPLILQCLSGGYPKTATQIGDYLDRWASTSGVTSTQFVEHLFKMPQIEIHRNHDCIRFSKKS
jgi:hypothetical protein